MSKVMLEKILKLKRPTRSELIIRLPVRYPGVKDFCAKIVVAIPSFIVEPA